MARWQTHSQILKSIAGAALIWLGVFVLSWNLAKAAAQLSEYLGITAEGAETLGVVTAVGLAASHALHTYLFDQQEFLRGVNQILMMCSPLLLVIAGMELLRDEFTDGANEFPNSNAGNVDLTVPRPTVK